jgi:hypothetical protein
MNIVLYEMESPIDDFSDAPFKICMKFNAEDKIIYRFIELNQLTDDLGF